MAKVIGQIFEEDNYDIFVKLDDNRDVLSGRLGKIVASISERYILNPIIVNEKFEIIDGQGRYEALKKLKRPIHYIIAPGATSDDCRRMNKYNTKWGKLDFAKSYAKAGKRSYANLLKACKDTSLSISRALRLANHSRTSNARVDETTLFETGGLVFTDDDVVLVGNVCKEIESVVEALQFSGRINDAFCTGVKVCMETKGYKHERMIANCQKCRSTFTQMARLGDQLIEFERIYNKGYTGKNRLYFSDYMRNRGTNVHDYSTRRTAYNDVDVSTLRSRGADA